MRFFKIVAVVAASLSLCSVAFADPLITAFIGTPSPTTKQAFFVLDFNDSGANPEVYNFGWNYEPAKTSADFPVALASALTGANGFTETHSDDPLFGRFFTSFGFNGRSLSSITTPAGYWESWLGFDGATWTSAGVGASFVTLSDTPAFDAGNNLVTASWTGWRWVPQFVPGVTTPAPRTAQIAVVPEAGTLTLAVLGLATAGTVVLRRRKR
ncbi:MAG: hypothetical protein H7Y38_00670 [Armatimonadetes bacterium]|nr:hypothetical protein [Armatimonadota bacterium]